uniref:Glycoside hydrolase family 3 N-terminal domain-containing protein n=1 Tax=Oryza brachyantha TaxID=4533 RepID=J3N7L2_ORYBR
MCAYTGINGVPACANSDLLTKTVRGDWGLDGYIASDCDAVAIMRDAQRYTPTPEDAVAVALKAGLDMNCGTYVQQHATAAIQQGKLTEEDIDKALKNLFAIRMRLGHFDGDPRSNGARPQEQRRVRRAGCRRHLHAGAQEPRAGGSHGRHRPAQERRRHPPARPNGGGLGSRHRAQRQRRPGAHRQLLRPAVRIDDAAQRHTGVPQEREVPRRVQLGRLRRRGHGGGRRAGELLRLCLPVHGAQPEAGERRARQDEPAAPRGAAEPHRRRGRRRQAPRHPGAPHRRPRRRHVRADEPQDRRHPVGRLPGASRRPRRRQGAVRRPQPQREAAGDMVPGGVHQGSHDGHADACCPGHRLPWPELSLLPGQDRLQVRLWPQLLQLLSPACLRR